MGFLNDNNVSLLKNQNLFICMTIGEFACSHPTHTQKSFMLKPVNKLLQNENCYLSLCKNYNFMRKRSSLTKANFFLWKVTVLSIW